MHGADVKYMSYRGERTAERGLWCASELKRRPRKVRSKKWSARKGGLFYREEEEAEKGGGGGGRGGEDCRCSFVILSGVAAGKVLLGVVL